MRNPLALKICSWFLLAVIVAAMTHGLCDETHASQHLGAADQASQGEAISLGHCPDCPGDHQDAGGCDSSCTNCICHTLTTLQYFTLTYSPYSSALQFPDRFKEVPEVYLSKFIPPQNAA